MPPHPNLPFPVLYSAQHRSPRKREEKRKRRNAIPKKKKRSKPGCPRRAIASLYCLVVLPGWRKVFRGKGEREKREDAGTI